jgi:hypothetical protein
MRDGSTSRLRRQAKSRPLGYRAVAISIAFPWGTRRVAEVIGARLDVQAAA